MTKKIINQIYTIMKRTFKEKLFPMNSIKNKKFTLKQEQYLKSLYGDPNLFIMGEDMVAIEYELKSGGRDLLKDTFISAGWWILILTPLIVLLAILSCI